MLLFRLTLVTLVLLLAAVLPLATAAPDCTWAAWDQTYDFSPLSLKDLRGFDGGGLFTYFLRPCGTLQSVPRCVFGSVNASACRVDNEGTGSRALGFFPPYGKPLKWGYISDTQPELGVYYEMEGQGGCAGTVPFLGNVVFNCVSSSDPPKPMNVQQFGCGFNFNLYTPLACLNSTTRKVTVATE